MNLNNRVTKLEARNPSGANYAVQFRPDGTCKVFYSGQSRQPDIMTTDEYHAFSSQPENRLLLATGQDLDEL